MNLEKELDFAKRAKFFNKYLLVLGIICLVAAVVMPPLIVKQRALEKSILGADYTQRQFVLEQIKAKTPAEQRLKQLLFIDEKLYRAIFSFMAGIIRFAIYAVLLIMSGSLFISYFHYKRFANIIEKLKK